MPESVVHFQIRMPPKQHEKLATWAKEDRVSLNLLVVGILEKAMERRHAEAGAGAAKAAPAHHHK
jgi:HicB family